MSPERLLKLQKHMKEAYSIELEGDELETFAAALVDFYSLFIKKDKDEIQE